MCVCVCTSVTQENSTEENGQDEVEEDSTVESDREEDINHDGLVDMDCLLQCPQTFNLPLTHRNRWWLLSYRRPVGV